MLNQNILKLPKSTAGAEENMQYPLSEDPDATAS